MSHTCAALSTAAGKAGVSVIRISGDDAFSISDKVFRCADGKALSEQPARKAVFGGFYGHDGVKIDSGLTVCFHKPSSYTGENTVEMSCHGSPVGVGLILGALFAAGAKPALPGEFTKRAFVNGKLDLTQAEAVADLLDAENASQLRLFTAQLDGGLGSRIKKVSDGIEQLLASVYAYIDYPDEDMSDLTDDQMKEEILGFRAELEKLTESYASGVAITRGVNTVIAGAPNTGKSTFFNLLAGYDRAIVTDIAGTTRDVITESVTVGAVKLLISDTAGIHDTDDVVEKIGVSRSEKALEECELLIALFDGSADFTDNDRNFISKISAYAKSRNVICVINKSDISDADAVQKIKEYLNMAGFTNILSVSAKSGDGKDEFEKAVLKLYPASSENEMSSGAILTNARQYAAVTSAVSHLDDALCALDTLTRDMAGLDLEEALGALNEADGRQVSEQVVNTIFSRFCVGK